MRIHDTFIIRKQAHIYDIYGRRRLMNIKTIVLAVVIGLFLIIVAQNAHVVTLRILFWQIVISQVILVPLAMAIGFVFGYLVAWTAASKRNRGKGS
jgi:uncharacterized integral membrane protein